MKVEKEALRKATKDHLNTAAAATGAPLSRHELHAFAEQAALVELRILLRHALEHLDFDTQTMCIVPSQQQQQRKSPSLFRALPHTWPEVWHESHTSSHAMVVTTAASPHTIVHVNPAWSQLCGYTAAQAYGQTFGIVQGPATNVQSAALAVQYADA